MAIVHIEIPKATEKELREYQVYKDRLFLESLNDESKQTPMKPNGAGCMGKLKFGVCPICGHAVVNCVWCEECYQTLDWREVQ